MYKKRSKRIGEVHLWVSEKTGSTRPTCGRSEKRKNRETVEKTEKWGGGGRQEIGRRAGRSSSPTGSRKKSGKKKKKKPDGGKKKHLTLRDKRSRGTQGKSNKRSVRKTGEKKMCVLGATRE